MFAESRIVEPMDAQQPADSLLGLRRWQLAALAVLLLLLAVFHVLRISHVNAKEVTDFTTFYESTRLAWGGGEPYALVRGRWPYIYPPTLLWAIGPVALLPYSAAVVGWTLFLFACWIAAAMIVHHLVRDLSPPSAITLLLPSLLAYRFILRSSVFGQVDLIVLLGTVAGLLALKHRRQAWGAIALAAATCIKVLPVVTSLVILLRAGRIRGLVIYGVALVALLAVPIIGWGPTRHLELVSAWREGQVMKHATNFALANEPANQSLSAALCRLMGIDTRDSSQRAVTTPEPDVRVPIGIWFVLASFFTGTTFLVALSHRREHVVHLEGALGVLLIHIVSRKTWETHLVTMLLVYGALICEARRCPRISRCLVGAITLAAFLQNFYSPLFVGEFADSLKYYSPTTLSLIVLWAATVLALLHRAPDDAPKEACEA